MRKQLLTFCLIMGLAANVLAASASVGQNIIINGQTIDKIAKELTFDGDNVVLHFSDGSSQTADMSTVSITFSTTTGIDNIQAFSLKDPTSGVLNINGLSAGQKIQVYDITGKKIAEASASEGTTLVDISNSKAGTYILRAGNNVIKFIKR